MPSRPLELEAHGDARDTLSAAGLRHAAGNLERLGERMRDGQADRGLAVVEAGAEANAVLPAAEGVTEGIAALAAMPRAA